MTKSSTWFTVDRDGLRDLHSGFPLERMVFEFISNAWDEKASRADVELSREIEFEGKPASRIVVRDNSPEGFRDMRDAFTLFRTTKKRSDATARGRFSLGEKLVISRSLWACIASTKGTIVFDKDGRHETAETRKAGTEVTVILPNWTDAEYATAMKFLQQILPPQETVTTVNGVPLQARIPDAVAEATLPTELLVQDNGTTRINRTKRRTKVAYYRVEARKAFLFEMGIPVCEIAGRYDLDVAQKVPVSSDRTTVAISYLQDLYAEALLALGDKVDAKDIGMSTVQMALEDDRISPEKAKEVFHQIFGEKAVLQSYRPDSDQEAARHGHTIVSPKAFGAVVNGKLREAGVSTAHDMFSRDVAEKEKENSIKYLSDAELDEEMKNFIGYVRMLASEIYHDIEFSVHFGRWSDSEAIALNSGRTKLIFHPERVKYRLPVSCCTSIVLHELAHAKGDGHNGVYDHEFERITNTALLLALRRPSLFHKFEVEAVPVL